MVVILEKMEEIAKYLPNATTKRLVKKRAILIYQGEIPRQAYVVLSGSFKVYRLSNNGEEQIVCFKTPGDIFPETWIFGRTSGTLYYYEALEDCEVLTIEKSTFLGLLDKQPELRSAMFEYMVESYTGLVMQISALGQSRAAEKLLLILYYLMFRYGKEKKSGGYLIDLQLTHTVIASLVGLTRETTTTELGRLKRKGVIYYDAKSFIVYREALEKKLGDDSFSNIKLR